MIQRIQTVFWVLAIILLALCFFLPYLMIAEDSTVFQFTPTGIITINSGVYHIGSPALWSTIALPILLLLATIFSYRNHKRQITFCWISILATLVIVALQCIFFFVVTRSFNGSYSYTIAIAFPLIALIFTILGLHGVRKDRAFLQKMNRIR